MTRLTPTLVYPIPEWQERIKSVLLRDDELRILPSAAYDEFPQVQLAVFCHVHAIYGLPTTELVECLRNYIAGRSAIEVGSGIGALGKALGIPCTDSFVQDRAGVRAWYEAVGQPPIKYGKHVIQIDALDAIRVYRPQVVIGQWVTQWVPPDTPASGEGCMFGIKEDRLLKKVQEYIVVGHTQVHGKKEIFSKCSRVIEAPWIRSRSLRPGNAIFFWKGEA